MEENKPNNKSKLILILSVIGCFLVIATPLTCGYFNGKNFHRELLENATVVNGIITGYKNPYKHAISFTYKVTINDTIFSFQSSGNQTDYAALKSKSSLLVGRRFPVLVNKQKHKQSKMLITPDDFAEYNMPFPDSLNFVKAILNN